MVRAAAIYTRISKDRDGEGLGVARQEQLCEQLAQTKGWPVAGTYCDNDLSAYSKKKRPAYEAMITDIQRGKIDAVICVDLDRLTRRTAELERFIEVTETHGIALANVSGDTDLSTSDGLFKAKLMANLAQHESHKKSERVKRQRAQHAERGEWSGSAPFGYVNTNGTLTIVEQEATLIREAAKAVLDGSATWRSVAQDLNARGITSRRGNQWTTNSVRITLTSPALAGLSVHSGQVVGEGKWEPILDRATHEALKSLRDRRKGTAGRPPSLLTRLVTCGNCGSKLYAGSSGRGRKIYVCRKSPGEHHGCGRLSIGRDDLEAQVLAKVLPHIATMPKPSNTNSESQEAKDLEQKLATLEARRSEFASLYGEGEMSRSEYEAAREANTKAIEKAQAKLAELGVVSGSEPSAMLAVLRRMDQDLDTLKASEKFQEWAGRGLLAHQLETGGWSDVFAEDQMFVSAAAAWIESPPDEQRKIIAEAVESIVVNKSGQGDRVTIVLA